MCYIDRKMNFARVAGSAVISDDKSQKEILWNNIPILRQHFAGPDDSNLVVIEIDTDTVEAMTPQQMEPEVLSLK